MTGQLVSESAFVPVEDGTDVEIRPGYPWPSPYRGSRYSLVESRRNNRGIVCEWRYKSMTAYANPAEGLVDAVQAVGKSDGTGKGSFRITAGGEVLTKVLADNYKNVNEAPVSEGWIPVYLGRLRGSLGFTDINTDPESDENTPLQVWEGFPFNHGEQWAVSVQDNLVWKWKDFRFQSAFTHSELIERYRRFREPPGRLYINEYGHVFVNIDPDQVPRSETDTVGEIRESWQREAEAADRTAALRLVRRRLTETAPDGNSANGLLPGYVGHLDEFDDGTIPRPVVDDARYYRAAASAETIDRY
jgi:hypothetical protein